MTTTETLNPATNLRGPENEHGVLGSPKFAVRFLTANMGRVRDGKPLLRPVVSVIGAALAHDVHTRDALLGLYVPEDTAVMTEVWRHIATRLFPGPAWSQAMTLYAYGLALDGQHTPAADAAADALAVDPNNRLAGLLLAGLQRGTSVESYRELAEVGWKVALEAGVPPRA